MNKRNKIEQPFQDEQDKEIDICSKGSSLKFMIDAVGYDKKTKTATFLISILKWETKRSRVIK
jgi:hypothetical protein